MIVCGILITLALVAYLGSRKLPNMNKKSLGYYKLRWR